MPIEVPASFARASRAWSDQLPGGPPPRRGACEFEIELRHPFAGTISFAGDATERHLGGRIRFLGGSGRPRPNAAIPGPPRAGHRARLPLAPSPRLPAWQLPKRPRHAALLVRGGRLLARPVEPLRPAARHVGAGRAIFCCKSPASRTEGQSPIQSPRWCCPEVPGGDGARRVRSQPDRFACQEPEVARSVRAIRFLRETSPASLRTGQW